MAWEKLARRGGPRRLPPDTVSITKAGRLILTPVKDEVGDAVDVWIDIDKKRIALVPNGNMLKVTRGPGTWSISCVGILSKFNKDDCIGRYCIERGHVADGVAALIIDLGEKVNG